MKARALVTLCVLALMLAAGCASTEVTQREYYEGQRIPRPNRILVHNFAAIPEDIPAGSTRVVQFSTAKAPQTDEEVEIGRQLGAQVAQELVNAIQSWGLTAVRAAGQPPAQVGDVVLMGYFESVDRGGAAERVLLGFGQGAAELTTEVEGYLMTDKGLRRLGSGKVESGGGKAPGVLVPIAVVVATGNPIGLIVGGAAKIQGEMSGRTTIEGTAKRTAEAIAVQLKEACQRQGWI